MTDNVLSSEPVFAPSVAFRDETEPAGLIRRLSFLRNDLRKTKPLIHCITNPISINDCANAILACGARPIMAEHPLETEEITLSAKGLALNLGNITDARMQSMKISAAAACKAGIPFVLDAVGVACSHLRLSYARDLIRQSPPSLIKGNISELKALCGASSHAVGIDAGEADRITNATLPQTLSMLQEYAGKQHCTLLCTGAEDLVVEPQRVLGIKNGCPEMSLLTGTGCMVNVLAACFLTVGSPWEAAVLAVGLMGICGEASAKAPGPGSFRAQLLDALYGLSDQEFMERLRLDFLTP